MPLVALRDPPLTRRFAAEMYLVQQRNMVAWSILSHRKNPSKESAMIL